MFEPSSSSRPADDTAEGEAARGYEEAWGHQRDAYIRHISTQQCVDPLDVPVINQGERPLYTSKIWSPSPSDAEEDSTVDLVEQEQVTLEVSSEEEPVQLAQQVRPV